ncbi:putative ATP-dependent endonuclease of OLD family [Methanococcus maripaludis]|uniref:Putative ATP-dependent endonuclease of OLD family n=1 Tax=Methanococcus maripaludis TaxID=39152 RepID=A0A7J9NV71_METMI|nr:AAA family ATPase [Methanococcus maripaludis]MBA2851569.1 putative ATP-dependent endonuclease of OLD family [Methanococcus maripaludis]
MYISEITLTNFRGFNNKTTIQFKEGINVIIGHNNSGKSTIIKALELLFETGITKRLTIDDFNKNVNIDDLKENPPKVTINAKLIKSSDEGEYSDELATVATWLTKLEKSYEAQLTYEFFLPERELKHYKQVMNDIKSTDNYWHELENNFLRKYVYKLYVGNPDHKTIVDSDTLKRFDFQFLNAIRDVERDMFSGKNILLREVIDFFMDYDIKTSESDPEVIKLKIMGKKKKFNELSQKIIQSLKDRMDTGKTHILNYASETGAIYENLKPDFEGIISDTDLYSILRLIVTDKTGISIPADHNGLGYNNLLYISLLLAKMQKNASEEYLGSNSKVFSILAIEEPEAHLHPSMQYKFLKFLNKNKENEVNQIFITSHSPNITAAVELDDLIVLSNESGDINIAYPGKVFSNSDEDKISKNYVKRFIDVTKADIFFSRGIIFVEGISEQIVIPEFAKFLNMDLIDSHISVINLGGRYFEHFLKLFDRNQNEYAINKKIACITDLDPVRKLKSEDGETDTSWKKCLPLFLNCDKENYDYKTHSNTLIDKNDYSENIQLFSQNKGCGCTFEYELILSNPKAKELVTDSVSNSNEIKRLMDLLDKEDIDSFINKLRNGKYKEEIQKLDYPKFDSEYESKKHILAGRYLNSVKKGAVAQEISYVISETKISELKMPKYIRDAITWIYPTQ